MKLDETYQLHFFVNVILNALYQALQTPLFAYRHIFIVVYANVTFNAKSMSLLNGTSVYKKTYLTHNKIHILVETVDVILTHNNIRQPLREILRYTTIKQY